MKSKIFTGIVYVIILLCLYPLYFSWKANVIIYTQVQEETPIVLYYTLLNKDKTYTKEKTTDAQGKVKFTISHKNIRSVHVESKAKIKEIIFNGNKKKSLKMDDDFNADTSHLSSRKSFRLIKFIMCCATIIYFSFFLHIKTSFPIKNSDKMMNIELLRCLFCCEVIYQHIAEQLHFFTRSLFSVEFFFLLSGYLFLKTRCYERTLWDIFSRKIKTFLPLTIFGSLTVGCIYEDINGFLGDILFLNSSFLPNSYSNRPLWFLSCMLWVFLFYSFVLKTFNRKTAVFLLTVLTLFGVFCFVRDNEAHWRVGNFVLTGGLCRAMAGIGVGMFVCYFSELSRSYKLKFGIATVLEIIALFGSIGAMHTKSINHFTIFLGFALLLLLFVRKEGVLSSFFDQPIWKTLGRYTFAVYVTHDVFAYRVLAILRDEYSFIMEHAYVSMLLCYVVIFLFAAIAYHVIGTKNIDFACLFLRTDCKEKTYQ